MEQLNTKVNGMKRQSYLRLISYAKPYWFRLMLGILAGMLVGGSVFVTLLMIPQMIGVVDIKTVDSAVYEREARRVITVLENSKAATAEEKIALASKALQPEIDDDPQLTKMLKQAKSMIKRFNLPVELKDRTVFVHWPVDFSFDMIEPNGRIAWQLFGIYVFFFVLAWLLKNIAKYANSYYTRWVGSKVIVDLRNKVFSKLMNQSLKFYGNVDTGQLISRCINDAAALEYAIAHSIEELTNAPLQLIGCIAAIVVACQQYDNYSLIFVLVIGFPLLLIPLQMLGRLIRKYYHKSYARIADVISRMHESFGAIKVIKAYNTEKMESDRFCLVNRKYFKQHIRAMRLHILVSPTIELAAVMGAMVFLIYSYQSNITVTQLAALLAPTLMAYQPLKELSKIIGTIQQSMAAADRFFELLDSDTELPEKADAVELAEFKQGIEVRDMKFSYDERKIIDGISFDIPRGSMVAVVGETGSGKSTIAHLLARFYDVSDGGVFIDGIDVRDYKISSLRSHIGVVNQEPILFNDTIAANIAYGSPDATMEDIENAAKLANAHEFITNGVHPEGYDTVVGENGFKLSGGEKQRVAIARAILRNPPILILDEATSALDNVTERLVQEALNRVMANRTVFAIAHRLSTIRHADRIIVLKQGRIAESGTHEELMALNGIYHHLHDVQFKH